MKKIFLLLTFHLSLLTFNIVAQPVQQEWVRRWDGPQHLDDGGLYGKTDRIGNIYVVGFTLTSNQGEDIVTVKYNTNGVQQWVATYNGLASGNDWPYGIAIDDSSNIYVSGYTTDPGSAIDWVIIKYNSSGVQQWVQRYIGPVVGDESPGVPVLDNNGYLYLSGNTSLSPNGIDVITIKYNAFTGDSIWVSRFHEQGIHGNYEDACWAVAVDNNGNVYATGSSNSWVGSPYVDYLTLKYNLSGVLQWSVKYNGPSNNTDVANLIALDSTGNIYVSGSSTGTTSYRDYLTIKYNPNGVQQWAARYNGTGNGDDIPTGMQLDKYGYIYITGYSDGGISNYDYATIKYNSNGDSLWVRRYNGPGNYVDDAYWIVLDDSGNVYVTGTSYNINNEIDISTIKYDTNGIQQWLMPYPGGLTYLAQPIAVDNVGNVFVTGRNNLNGTGDDIITIKYTQITGLQPVSHTIPSKCALYQNFPNPFNSATKIEFDLSRVSKTNLTVYDVLGRKLATLIDQKLSPGKYRVVWDAGRYSSGVYFYTLKTESFYNTKKMILIK